MQGEELLPVQNTGLELLYQEANNALIAEQKFRQNNRHIRQLAVAVVGLLSLNVLAGIEIATDGPRSAVAMEVSASTTTPPETSTTTSTSLLPETTTTAPKPIDTLTTTTSIPPEVILNAAAVVPSEPETGMLVPDISWPNCSFVVPQELRKFGIIGVTGGHPFSNNPCLKDEAEQFDSIDFYINTAYPGFEAVRNIQDAPQHCEANDANCFAFNSGFVNSQGAFNYADSLGLVKADQTWWHDVEVANSWEGSTDEHQNVLMGSVAGIRAAMAQKFSIPPLSVKNGFYSTPYMWKKITGDWRNDMPNWVATIEDDVEGLKSRCQDSNFTATGKPGGGATHMVQHVSPQYKIDNNYICK